MGDSWWRIRVDTGGTFTDGIARAPDGHERSIKLLSTSALRGRLLRRLAPGIFEVEEDWGVEPATLPGLQFRFPAASGEHARVKTCAKGRLELDAAPARDAGPLETFELRSAEPAPLFAARLLTGTPLGAPLPPTRMRLATTLGTNALLERDIAPTALFVTRGFGDLLTIGTQQRPDLFAMAVQRPRPLYDAVVEVHQRMDPRGRVLVELDLDSIEETIRRLVDRGIRCAAVALMHSWRDPRHEQALARRLRARGFSHVSCSADLGARIKLLPRAETAVVDACLSPRVAGYLDRVAEGLSGGSLLVMTSAGGLLDRDGFRAKDSLLSGPAGGVVGAARAGRSAGFERVIGFDMGGTSTDVARFDGDFEYVYEHRVGDAHVVAPALALQTVASGGGSICWRDGERLRVGPRSAGAEPGPACYGAGGPLTLTDVNLLLGRVDPTRFRVPVDAAPARARLDELLGELRETGASPVPEAVLEGLLAIADETMAEAIRRISLRRGADPREYALVSFGGAGGQHACAVADLLGISAVVVPPDASLLSARGLGQAAVERFAGREVLRPLAEVEGQLPAEFAMLAEHARDQLAGIGAKPLIRRRTLELRFAGQDSGVEVFWHPELDIGGAFVERYRALYGHLPERREIELVSMRVVAACEESEAEAVSSEPPSRRLAPLRHVAAWMAGARRQIPVFERETLAAGACLDGPALVHEPTSTTVVAPGWGLEVADDRSLLLRRRDADVAATTERPAAVRLELFTRRFTGLVREMGERLERTAVSTNVKERLDFSCALLDTQGELVVNAPHIPVHLGALGLCVRSVAARLELQPGDVAVTNHPAHGGSHLPDVTVITPVHTDDGCRAGYVASRAHHAEIGGTRPGSMPPSATRLAEEGVVLPPMRLVEAGVPRWERVRRLLQDGRWPSRSVEDNLADLRAAVAANHAGAEGLRALVRSHGAGTIDHYMRELKRLAAERMGQALRRLGDGSYHAEQRLDDGTRLEVRIDVAAGSATVDFAGTAPVHPGNLNATPAIARSAVLYVLRLLLDRPLPLNEGLLRDVRVVVPRGLLDPGFPADASRAPAVVGGNVETSQRLVDTLLLALRLCACSQGTMNNLIFGNAGYGYYETLGGGCGAGPGFAGADAVHSHMTNTRITDPEVLEHRYPVRIERFAVRHGSGGGGARRGGNGLVRKIRFLETASLSILSQHRVEEPYGLEGGAPGKRGRQWVVRADGSRTELGSIDGCEVQAGDSVVVETPGGGGWGLSDGG